jgi:hypothetical protein
MREAVFSLLVFFLSVESYLRTTSLCAATGLPSFRRSRLVNLELE